VISSKQTMIALGLTWKGYYVMPYL